MSHKKSRPLRVLLVDDHPIVRYGLRRLIDAENDMSVCGEAEGAEDCMEAVKGLEPDIALLDISLKEQNGITLAGDLKTSRPDLPLLMLSFHEDDDSVERALTTGARGYVTKHEAPEVIVSAIRRVMAGEIFLSDRMATRLLRKLAARPSAAGDDNPVSSLSNRELEILEMIGRGRGPRQIAEALHLSIHTIETHRRHIKEKLDLDTASALADFAEQWLLGRR
jgi:DNA-binding NarL/FixJ family response regulator